MTNPDMVKVKGRKRGPGQAPNLFDDPDLPRPNPPAPLSNPNFQRNPEYPAIDPLDSNQLKPMLDEKPPDL